MEKLRILIAIGDIIFSDQRNNLVKKAEFSLAAGASRVDIDETTWRAGRGNVVEELVVVVVPVVTPVGLLDEHQPPDRSRAHGPELVIGLRLRVPSLFSRKGEGLSLAGWVVGEERAKCPVVGGRGPHFVASRRISPNGAGNG